MKAGNIPNLGKPLFPKPLPSPVNLIPDASLGSFSSSPVSPTVQQTINQIERQTSSTSTLDPPNQSRIDKRKSESSPETGEMSRKEKKILKAEEKKQDKLKKKLEYKEKNSVQVLINHSY